MKREVDFKALKHVSYRKDVSKIDVRPLFTSFGILRNFEKKTSDDEIKK